MEESSSYMLLQWVVFPLHYAAPRAILCYKKDKPVFLNPHLTTSPLAKAPAITQPHD